MKQATITKQQAYDIEESITDVLDDVEFGASTHFLDNRLKDAGCNPKHARRIINAITSAGEGMTTIREDRGCVDLNCVLAVAEDVQRAQKLLAEAFRVKMTGAKGQPIKRLYVWTSVHLTRK